MNIVNYIYFKKYKYNISNNKYNKYYEYNKNCLIGKLDFYYNTIYIKKYLLYLMSYILCLMHLIILNRKIFLLISIFRIK